MPDDCGDHVELNLASRVEDGRVRNARGGKQLVNVEVPDLKVAGSHEGFCAHVVVSEDAAGGPGLSRLQLDRELMGCRAQEARAEVSAGESRGCRESAGCEAIAVDSEQPCACNDSSVQVCPDATEPVYTTTPGPSLAEVLASTSSALNT